MADSGYIRSGIVLASAASVFAEKHVQHSVELILYAQVQKHGNQHQRCRCWRTADKVSGFLGCRVADDPLAVNRHNVA